MKHNTNIYSISSFYFSKLYNILKTPRLGKDKDANENDQDENDEEDGRQQRTYM